jgi:glycosyltransferase involved in cell wall biosynthesis
VNQKKKLLVLTPRYPFPVIGGDRLRIYNQCKELSKKYELTLLSLCETHNELGSELPNDGVFTRIERVFLSKIQSYFNAFVALFSFKPLQVAYYYSSSFQELVNRELEKHDLVLCHLIRTTDYVRHFNGLKVVEMTDAISLNYKRVKENNDLKGLKSWIYRIEQKRLLSYECQIINEYNLCSLISPIDQHYLEQHCRSNNHFVISGNGVDISNFPFHYQPYEKKRSPLRLVFIGAMSTLQNFDAAYWFASKTLPLIASDFDVVFEVIGHIPDGYKEKLASLNNVILHGGVESVSLAAKGAHIGVCPMRIGAGVQNKVLEYMALGLPCISTSLGLEGINANNLEHLLIADTPQEFCEAVKKITLDSLASEKMANNARTLIDTKYSWTTQQYPFIDSIYSLMDCSIIK